MNLFLILFIILLCIFIFYKYSQYKQDKFMTNKIENFGKININPLYFSGDNNRNKYLKVLAFAIGKFHINKKNHIELCKKFIYKNNITSINLKNKLHIARYLFIHGDDELKCDICSFLIKNSDNNKEIYSIYFILNNIAKNTINSNLCSKVIDILRLSNNDFFINESEKHLHKLRKLSQKQEHEETKSHEIKQHNIKQYDIIKQRENNNNLIIDIPQTPIDQIINFIPNTPTPSSKDFKNIFKDNQNVHNSNINDSVLKAARKIINDNPVSSFINYELPDGYLNKKDTKKVNISLHRIYTDDIEFRDGVKLINLFQSILIFIEKHKYKDELNTRLIQELIEMSNLCVTGHLDRLVSVVQGFDNEKYKITMSIYDEMYSKITHEIQKNIENYEYKDVIIEDMTYNNRTYIEYLLLFVSTHKDSYYKEYSELLSKKIIDENIVKILNSYLKYDVFKINDKEKIVLK